MRSIELVDDTFDRSIERKTRRSPLFEAENHLVDGHLRRQQDRRIRRGDPFVMGLELHRHSARAPHREERASRKSEKPGDANADGVGKGNEDTDQSRERAGLGDPPIAGPDEL